MVSLSGRTRARFFFFAPTARVARLRDGPNVSLTYFPNDFHVTLFGFLPHFLPSFFSESQLRAVSAALEKQPITLIQGPPGTGKTRIVLSLLSAILHAEVSGSASARFGTPSDLKTPKTHTNDDHAYVSRYGGRGHSGEKPQTRVALDARRRESAGRAADVFGKRWKLFVLVPELEPPEAVARRRPHETLVCAPSNAALDEIVMRTRTAGFCPDERVLADAGPRRRQRAPRRRRFPWRRSCANARGRRRGRTF